jgi:hypothetical protein
MVEDKPGEQNAKQAIPQNLYRYRLRKGPKRPSRSKEKKEILEDQSGTWVYA